MAKRYYKPRTLTAANGRKVSSQAAVARSLKKYGLKPGNYAVHGSAVLERHGVRSGRDLDIVVGRKTFKRLKATGEFRRAPFSNRVLISNIYLGEVAKVRRSGFVPAKRHIRRAQVIGGVPYLPMKTLRLEKTKSAVTQKHRRAKDTNDLKLIRGYVHSKSYRARTQSLRRRRDSRGRFA